jgi:hypothetical protein
VQILCVSNYNKFRKQEGDLNPYWNFLTKSPSKKKKKEGKSRKARGSTASRSTMILKEHLH